MKSNYEFSRGKRGAVAKTTNKIKTSIRFDPEILNWFKNKAIEAGGGNYQTLINQALKDYMATQGEPLERVLRRVIREEMHTGNAA